MGTGYPLVVFKTETFTKLRTYPLKILLHESLLVCGGNTYFYPDKLILTPGIPLLSL